MIPKIRVKKNAVIDSDKEPKAKPRWAQVIPKPETIKRNVFKAGKSKKLIEGIPAGGQWVPNSTEGPKEEWKKAQKKPKNSIISETIKSRKPFFNPRRTINVWSPLKVASLIISKNQENIQKIKTNKLINNKNPPNIIRCK